MAKKSAHNVRQPNVREQMESWDFEQQVVCKVLRSGGVIGNIESYLEENKNAFLAPTLNLVWFHQKFPAFPLRIVPLLCDDKLPTWTKMFSQFEHTMLFQSYKRVAETHANKPVERPLGVVFNKDGITFVLHNYRAAASLPGRRIVRILGIPPVTYAFEEFATLLRCIDSEWASKSHVFAREQK